MSQRKKTYEVVGAAPVFDHQPGETFEAQIDKTHEEYLVNVGALKVVKAEKKK